MELAAVQTPWHHTRCPRWVSQVAETCRTHGAADVEVYPTDLTDHAAVDDLAKKLLDKHKVCAVKVSSVGKSSCPWSLPAVNKAWLLPAVNKASVALLVDLGREPSFDVAGNQHPRQQCGRNTGRRRAAHWCASVRKTTVAMPRGWLRHIHRECHSTRLHPNDDDTQMCLPGWQLLQQTRQRWSRRVRIVRR